MKGFEVPEFNRIILTSTDDSIEDGIFIDEDQYNKYLKEINWDNKLYSDYIRNIEKREKRLTKDNLKLTKTVKKLQKELIIAKEKQGFGKWLNR